MDSAHSRNSYVDRHSMLFLLGLGIATALLMVAGSAMSQTAVPAGNSKPAEYSCSGLEGVALTSCRQLNAAAVGGAIVTPGTARGRNYDCAGMSGSALATCRDLNGEIAVPAASDGGVGSSSSASVDSARDSAIPGGAIAPQSTQPNVRTMPGAVGAGASPSGTAPGAAGGARNGQ